MDNLQQILERIEKRQIENQMNIESLNKKIQIIMENLGIERKEDSPKIKEPKELTRLSMECVLSYMDLRKRLSLSLFYPKVRPIEKSVPLVVKDLHISASEISIDEIILQVHKDKRSDVDFSKICFDLFTGRSQFKVHTFQCEVRFPFEMNIKVDNALVQPGKGLFAENYSNITGTIKNVRFLKLDREEDLRLPWVQNVDRMESIEGGCYFINNVLHNILAKKIYIDCRTYSYLCPALILIWCENKTRAVGSELFLTMFHSEEQRILDNVVSLRLHTRFGFVRYDDDSLRLPMDNNSEVVLRRNNERHHFTHFYLECTKPRNYLHLKVQHL